MLFGLCNAPATFQRLMHNCLREVSLMYCLIYLDDMIVFSKTEEEHVQCLHIVLDHFWEHNLKLKLTTWEFFWNEINIWFITSPKRGWDQAKRIWKLWQNLFCPELAKGIWTFLGLVVHYWQFIKGFAHIVQPLLQHLSGEGASKKSEWLILTAETNNAFKMLKPTCLEVPVLVFANFNKPFLLEMDASKLGLGAVLSQK